MTQTKAQQQKTFFLQFPALERLMETEEFDDLNRTFIEAYDVLEKISLAKPSARMDVEKKKSARKIMRALELTMNLLRDFLQVKDDLIRQGVLPPVPPKRGKAGQ